MANIPTVTVASARRAIVKLHERMDALHTDLENIRYLVAEEYESATGKEAEQWQDCEIDLDDAREQLESAMNALENALPLTK